jgi:hypothetical protein
MNAAERFVEGRGAVPIQDLAKWCGRSASFVYRAIGRGELRIFTPGRVTADSVVDWYRRYEGTPDAVRDEPVGGLYSQEVSR